MNHDLTRTDTLWYKIKKFLGKIFHSKCEKYTNQVVNNTNKSLNKNNFIKELNGKTTLANKLLSYEISTSELTEKEVDEMFEYFTNDIEGINNELERIKQHIIAMQQELKKHSHE